MELEKACALHCTVLYCIILYCMYCIGLKDSVLLRYDSPKPCLKKSICVCVCVCSTNETGYVFNWFAHKEYLFWEWTDIGPCKHAFFHIWGRGWATGKKYVCILLEEYLYGCVKLDLIHHVTIPGTMHNFYKQTELRESLPLSCYSVNPDCNYTRYFRLGYMQYFFRKKKKKIHN